ncbi:uncharacterized protein BJ171DRAFT_507547 [Polychytrium aggregatum]|uniref:uncharacterized protein n=1 Tax=Polychytrium aggregatum TaxID=110093 RepID=UPI0022FE5AF7|nr:uncharacterized protein BJ171DRAFT_507547 [Polychytrium aggregatum]KAI9204059.1 hypothetical protein BJ171DRAFT_507547 [Polychytrium aggregatum]
MPDSLSICPAESMEPDLLLLSKSNPRPRGSLSIIIPQPPQVSALGSFPSGAATASSSSQRLSLSPSPGSRTQSSASGPRGSPASSRELAAEAAFHLQTGIQLGDLVLLENNPPFDDSTQGTMQPGLVSMPLALPDPAASNLLQGPWTASFPSSNYDFTPSSLSSQLSLSLAPPTSRPSEPHTRELFGGPPATPQTFHGSGLLSDDDHSDRFLRDLVAQKPTEPPTMSPEMVLPSSLNYAVLKISNIPWDLTLNDLTNLFSPVMIPVGHHPPTYTHCIHILMNRVTGKTLSDAFVEFPSIAEAQAAMELHRGQRIVVKGRCLALQPSCQEELLTTLFPTRYGIPLSARASVYTPTHGESPDIAPRPFLHRDEINGILLICRNLKVHFARRCSERPFENIISILAKLPWNDPESITVMQRDHIFEMLKLAMESLVGYIQKEKNPSLSVSLSTRLLRAGLCVPLFTERQKSALLHVSQLECPDDLRPLLNDPTTKRSLKARTSPGSTSPESAGPHLDNDNRDADASDGSPNEPRDDSQAPRSSLTQRDNRERTHGDAVDRLAERGPAPTTGFDSRLLQIGGLVDRIQALEMQLHKTQHEYDKLRRQYDYQMLRHQTEVRELETQNRSYQHQLARMHAWMRSMELSADPFSSSPSPIDPKAHQQQHPHPQHQPQLSHHRRQNTSQVLSPGLGSSPYASSRARDSPVGVNPGYGFPVRPLVGGQDETRMGLLRPSLLEHQQQQQQQRRMDL